MPVYFDPLIFKEKNCACHQKICFVNEKNENVFFQKWSLGFEIMGKKHYRTTPFCVMCFPIKKCGDWHSSLFIQPTFINQAGKLWLKSVADLKDDAPRKQFSGVRELENRGQGLCLSSPLV